MEKFWLASQRLLVCLRKQEQHNAIPKHGQNLMSNFETLNGTRSPESASDGAKLLADWFAMVEIRVAFLVIPRLSGTYQRNRPRKIVLSKWTMHAYPFYFINYYIKCNDSSLNDKTFDERFKIAKF